MGAYKTDIRKEYPASQTQTESPFNMQERKEPTLIKFGDGEQVRGVLVAVDQVEVKGKRVNQYVIEDMDSKERASFLGTYQIDVKLRRSDVGHVVQVVCTGEDRNVQRNGNAMKTFRVLVSDRKAPGWANDGTPITDDDIAF